MKEETKLSPDNFFQSEEPKKKDFQIGISEANEDTKMYYTDPGGFHCYYNDKLYQRALQDHRDKYTEPKKEDYYSDGVLPKSEELKFYNKALQYFNDNKVIFPGWTKLTNLINTSDVCFQSKGRFVEFCEGKCFKITNKHLILVSTSPFKPINLSLAKTILL